MKEQIEKNSPTLSRNAMYTKSKSIARLPKYLTIHMNRMFWRDDTKKKAKIMRRVQFPFDLDVHELCSPELKEKLQPFRDLWRLQEDERERHRVSPLLISLQKSRILGLMQEKKTIAIEKATIEGIQRRSWPCRRYDGRRREGTNLGGMERQSQCFCPERYLFSSFHLSPKGTLILTRGTMMNR